MRDSRSRILLSVAALSLAACTGPNQPGSQVPSSLLTSNTPTTVTITEQVEQPSTSTDEIAPPIEQPSDPSTSVTSGPPIVTGTSGQPQTLTLDQAVHNLGWSEKIDTPVGRSLQQVKEIQVSCSAAFNDSEMLEYRFSGSSGTLSVTVQQALSSDTSDGVVEAALFVDGRQSLQQLGFKETKTFTTPLTGVNAVKIAIRGVVDNSGLCPGEVTAVITNISITS